MFKKTKIAMVCGLTLMCVGIAHAQHNGAVPQYKPPPMPALSAADKQHILHDKFIVIKHVQNIPKAVLAKLVGKDPLSNMADPNKPFETTDVIIGKPLPGRRLIFAATSPGYCLVFNEYGGIAYGTTVSWYHVSRGQAMLMWKAYVNGGNPKQNLTGLRALIAKNRFDTTTIDESLMESPMIQTPAITGLKGKASWIPTLSAIDRQHILHDKFVVVKTVKSIPISVLKTLIGKGPMCGMADPNEPFERTDTINRAHPLPFHRLRFAALSTGYCLLYDEHGGYLYGTEVSLYHLSGTKSKLVWKAVVDQKRPSHSLSALQKLIAQDKCFDEMPLEDNMADLDYIQLSFGMYEYYEIHLLLPLDTRLRGERG